MGIPAPFRSPTTLCHATNESSLGAFFQTVLRDVENYCLCLGFSKTFRLEHLTKIAFVQKNNLLVKIAIKISSWDLGSSTNGSSRKATVEHRTTSKELQASLSSIKVRFTIQQ